MKIIGITGGIGSGKSTVSKYLEEKGCIIIDADKISRELTGEGGDALVPLLEAFGPSIFNEEGLLDRKKLASIVFSDSEKKKILESIVSDMTKTEILGEIDKLKAQKYEGNVVLDCPLLFEFNMQEHCDETWVIIANLETRIARVRKRDGATIGEVVERIKNQMSDAEKEKLADHVIDNSADKNWLYTQLDSQLYRLR